MPIKSWYNKSKKIYEYSEQFLDLLQKRNFDTMALAKSQLMLGFV